MLAQVFTAVSSSAAAHRGRRRDACRVAGPPGSTVSGTAGWWPAAAPYRSAPLGGEKWAEPASFEARGCPAAVLLTTLQRLPSALSPSLPTERR
jgi:hypothetical protein